MSILLDALRKSEQQKQLGSVPDINSLDFEPEASGRSPWIRPALAVVFIVLLLAVGYVLWKQFAVNQQTAGSADLAVAEMTESTAASQPAAATQEPPKMPSVDGALAGESDNMARESTASSASAERLDRQPRSPVETLSGDSPYQPSAAPARQADENRTRAGDRDEPAVVQHEAPRPGVATVELESSRPTEQPQSAREARQARREAQAQEQAEQEETGLISYWQLPETTREALPPFKISVLVYDTDPGGRFVLMNGKRYGTGDEVSDRLELVSIQRERVIFRYGAYRFFVNQGR